MCICVHVVLQKVCQLYYIYTYITCYYRIDNFYRRGKEEGVCTTLSLKVNWYMLYTNVCSV